jgi:hypothetical protein
MKALVLSSYKAFHAAEAALCSVISRKLEAAPAVQVEETKPAATAAPSPNPFDAEAVVAPAAATLPLPPLPAVATLPLPPLPAAGDWRTLPQWFKDRNLAYYVASREGREALRRHQLWTGSWATLPNKKRVMVYKNHAYEPPADRDYCEPGPLKHLGFYNRATHSVDALADGQQAPEIPQTLQGYPWTSAYEVYEANKRALAAGL